ncbi:hypothetical protein GCM10023238_06730 [Streptomyces heliomycini]
MQGDDVGAGQERVEGDGFGVRRGHRVVGDVRVVGEDAHAEGARVAGDEPADPAEADDPEGPAVQFRAEQLGPAAPR